MPASNSSAPHREPQDLSDRFAFAFTKLLRFFADALA